MNINELRARRDAIQAIAKRHGAERIMVFGSVATGRATADSDVDFLVDMAHGSSLFDLGALDMDLRELLGCEVDVVTKDGLRPRLRQQALREAIPL